MSLGNRPGRRPPQYTECALVDTLWALPPSLFPLPSSPSSDLSFPPGPFSPLSHLYRHP